MRALGSSVHAMALELRACDRRRHKLARRVTGAHAIERLERQYGTQTQGIAAKDGSHRVINDEQRMDHASRAAQSAKVGHTQAKATDGVDEPPQVRPLGIKRSIKAFGRGGKRRSRRLPHQHNIAAIKTASKRFGKVIRKGHQAVTGMHDTQQRQSRRHMLGSDKTRLTRTSPCSPVLL